MSDFPDLSKSLIQQSQEFPDLSKPPSVADTILKQVQLQNAPQQQETRSPQMQEEFSNPTQWPGFDKLSKQEQLERIKLSQFDPANQTSVGTSMPSGSYEHPATRMLASVLPTLAVPGLSVGEGLAAKYLLNPAINAAARIGAGTGGNLAYESPDINNMQQLGDATKRSLGINALIEGAIAPLRFAGGMAEMFNPIQYGANKADQIRNEYTAAKTLQEQAYAPVTQKYGDTIVTADPKNYLGFGKADIKYFTPDVKKSYGDFLDEPTFQNLHDLQSQMGRDWARVSTNPGKINTAQTLDASRNSIKDKIQSFLGPDENALNQYNLGSEITKNQVMPYVANKTLRKVVEGVNPGISPAQLSNAIGQGTQKVISRGPNGITTAIPAGHALRNHMADLEQMINFGKSAQTIAPALTGAVTGEMLHPGLGGAVAGAASGLGASQMANMAAKFGAPSMTGLIQNPLIQNALKKLSPFYYSGARVLGNELGKNELRNR